MSKTKPECHPVLSIEMIPVWPKGSGPGGWKIKLTRRVPPGGIRTERINAKNFDAAVELLRHTLAVDGYEPQEDS